MEPNLASKIMIYRVQVEVHLGTHVAGQDGKPENFWVGRKAFCMLFVGVWSPLFVGPFFFLLVALCGLLFVPLGCWRKGRNPKKIGFEVFPGEVYFTPCAIYPNIICDQLHHMFWRECLYRRSLPPTNRRQTDPTGASSARIAMRRHVFSHVNGFN